MDTRRRPAIRSVVWFVRVLAILAGIGSPGLATAQGPVDSSEARLILADLYAVLDTASPRLSAARQMAVAANARIAPARTLPDPQLQFGLMNRNLPGFGLQDPLGMYQVQLMQMVPIAGQLGLAGQAAAAQAGATEARATDLLWELRARVAMEFYMLYRLDRTIEVLTETQTLVRDIGTTARTLYAVGQGRQADVLRAQVEVDRMTEEIARMSAMRAGAAARLNTLLNRAAAATVPTPALPRLPRELPPADSLEQLALDGRPMLAAAALDVQAAIAAERRARREIWPDLQLGAIYGQRPMVEGTDRMISLMVGFSVPIWAGRRQLKMRQETEAMRRSAEAELAAMQAETRGRLGELAAELTRVQTLRDLYAGTILPQAEATITSALSAYRVGEVDLLMLLDARMTVNRYRQQVFQLEAEHGAALAELEMLLGRSLFDPSQVEQPPGERR